ncbi:MAG: MATE family efflux transporter [bacterium]|nr:MATE family efflux transporter [bacterium]
MLGNILRLAGPMILAQLINVLYNVIDRIYIGRWGENASDALTGLGVCLPVITVVIAFANLIGTGGAPLFSIERGRKNSRETEALMGNSFALLLGIAVVITLIIYITKRPVLMLLGASNATLPYADSYLSVYSVGTIFVMISLGMNSFINAQGFSKTGMLTVLIGAGLNIVLDPIFIFGLKMGVTGAALATVISQGASAAWTLTFLLGKRTEVKLKLSAMRLKPARVRKILSLGVSGFVMGLTNSAVTMVCNAELRVYGGDTYIAVMTIINSVREMISMPVMGMTNSIQPVLGYNYGAGLMKRVKTGIRDSSVILVLYTLVMWIAVVVFSEGFLGMFTRDTAIIEAGLKPLHIYFFGFVFMALQFSGQSIFVGLGCAKRAVFFSIFRKVIIVIPLTVLLPRVFGVHGVFAAEPISNVIGGSASFLTMYFTLYRKLDK